LELALRAAALLDPHAQFLQVLTDIFKLRQHFNPKLFESFHSLWEQLILFSRLSEARYFTIPINFKSITLGQLYNPTLAGDSWLWDVPVDSSTIPSPDIAKYFVHTANDLERPIPNVVYLPTNVNNAGFDLVKYFRSSDGKTTIPVAFQNKWSKMDASTTLSESTVREAFSNTQNSFPKDQQHLVCMVFLCWRDVTQSMKVPDRVFVLDRRALMQLYGPTFAHMLEEVDVVCDFSIHPKPKRLLLSRTASIRFSPASQSPSPVSAPIFSKPCGCKTKCDGRCGCKKRSGVCDQKCTCPCNKST
jgi:hypothetical protein